MITLYWTDTIWGCGGVYVKDGIVIASAPIFRKLRGERIEKLKKIYKVVKI